MGESVLAERRYQLSLYVIWVLYRHLSENGI